MTTRPSASGQFWPDELPSQKQSSGESSITAYCDGGSRGNPGPSGYGVFIQDAQGQTLGELSEFLGKKTNNFAEYSGLLAALEFALSHRHSRLRVVSDSELMVKQIKGQYRVNSPELKLLYEEAKHRIAQLESFQIQHVLREKNRRADELANLAMDRGTGRTPAARPGQPESKSAEKPQTLSGFVKGGVIHLLDGELPDGIFVKITRERS
jgi:probable phosphoglycerate mutase